MNDLPLHPVLVHLPIALAVLMPLVAAVSLLAWQFGWMRRRGWLAVVGMQAVLLISGLAASSAGEEDEELVEDIVPEAALEQHEEAAEVFLWGAGVVLVLAAAVLVVPRDGAARGVGAVALAGTVAVLWLGYRVGHAGGELVYRHGAAAPHVAAANAGPGAGPARHDDDD